MPRGIACVRCFLLLLLLSPDHGQHLFAEGPLTVLANVESLFLAVVEFADGEVQVADAAARAVLLACNLAILCEQLPQR